MINKATLKIKSDNGITSGSVIELNGQAFPVRKIKIEGDSKGYWIVEAEFFLSNLDVELDATRITISNPGAEII